MPLFKPTALSSEQIERRRRIRAKGRKHYIFYRGILAWGLPMLLLSTLWRWHDDYGWHTPRRTDLSSEIIHLLIGPIIWSTAGYFFGVAMWKQLDSDQSSVKG